MNKFVLFFLAGCATPVVNPPEVVILPVINPPAQVDGLESIVKANGCKDVVFGNRGKPQYGFLVGMVKSYQQVKCDKDLTARLTKAPHSKEDAYVRYGLSPTLPNVFAFMVGLAAQESSFKACTGRDASAGSSSASSDTCESGAWQTSYNSRGFSSYLPVFFKTWKKDGFYSDFYNIKTSRPCGSYDAKNWGTGVDGLRFQEMSKKQPAFQLEYTMLLLKETYRHHGPIVRREVKFVNSCKELFENVDAATICQ
jgi:hypothetical protein